ncbi:MAG: hypothetical protein LBH20_07010, partial [Treponema sp.]|nr:hypothetical protein [Treponema sp.]
MNRHYLIMYILICILTLNCSKSKNKENNNILNELYKDKNNTSEINQNSENDSEIIIELKYVQNYIPPMSGNYENGNGTIIEIKYEDNVLWTFRKHIQQMKMNWFDDFPDLIIYDKPLIENGNIVGTLRNENLNVAQVVEANVQNTDFYHWIKIYTNNNISGWIFFGKYDYNFSLFRTPYFNNRWEIIETIKNNNGVWTIRKLDGGISIIPFTGDIFEFTVHNEPGFNSEIIEILNPRENNTSQINLDIIAATEELDTIEGIDFKIT